MAEDLYREELEFKELHNEFLKRPAAVTINKPFLSNNEMEDVLTRLLRNYVPPKYVEAYRVPSMSGGLGIRAILMCYKRTLKSKTKVESKDGWNPDQTVSSMGYTHHATVNLSTETSDYGPEGAPFATYYIKWEDSVIVSSNIPNVTIKILKAKAKQGKINGKDVQDLEDGATADNAMYGLATDAEMDQTTGCVTELPDASVSPGGIDCYLYLFCKSDHDWMLLGNENRSENTVFARYIGYFKDQMPDYRGETVLYYPDKNKKTSEKFITRETIKKAFGCLPYNEVKAYSWHFILDNKYKTGHPTLMHITKKRAIDLYKGAGNELSLDAFYNQIAFITKALHQNDKYRLPASYLNGLGQPIDIIYSFVFKTVRNIIDEYYAQVGTDPVERRNNRILTNNVEFKQTDHYKRLLSTLKQIRNQAESLDGRLHTLVKAGIGTKIKNVGADGSFYIEAVDTRPRAYIHSLFRKADPNKKTVYYNAKTANQLPLLQATWESNWVDKVFDGAFNVFTPIGLAAEVTTKGVEVGYKLAGGKEFLTPSSGTAETALRSISTGLTSREDKDLARSFIGKNSMNQHEVGSAAYNNLDKVLDEEASYVEPDGYRHPIMIQDLLNALDDYELSANGDITDPKFFLHNNYYSLMPILPFDATNTNLRNQERANVRQANKEVNRVTTEGEQNMSLLDFKVRYYSVLVEMLKKKVDKYSVFIEDGIMQFPLKHSFETVYQMAHEVGADGISGFSQEEQDSLEDLEIKVFSDKEKVAYCSLCEELFFGVLSGFFITSNTRDNASVNAPIWNAMPSKETMLKYNYTSGNVDRDQYYQMEGLNRFGNFDVSAINISKVVHGSSRASIEIKNDKDKYSFPRNLVLNRTEVCIEPMDRVVIYLPTYEDTIKPVFTGIISTVTGRNDEGYHSLVLEVDCNLKNLKVTRTNMKPSVVREENGNNKVTPFTAPMEMYASLEKWLPIILMEACSYYSCMPRKATIADANVKLFNYENQKITATVGVNKYKEDVLDADDARSMVESIKSDSTTELVKAGASYSGGTTGGNYTTATYNRNVVRETQHLKFTTVTVSDGRTTLYLGTFKAVNFADPLFNYLWYKSASKFPPEEWAIITNAQSEIIKDYIKTDIVNSEGKHLTPDDGITSLHEELKLGNRCAYLVYKQRYSGTWVSTNPNGIEDRTLVATIIGTSQPTFFLSNQKQSYQQSNWKTNLQIITETADKMNFCFYCDNAGVIRFTPYNFDLTLLNTRNFSKGDDLGSVVDFYCMLNTRKAKDLEGETNPMVLTKQHIFSYDKAVSDTKLVNWLRLTGDFIVQKNQFIQAQVMDPVLIKKYGIHTGSPRNITGISSETSLQLYGLSWMDRQNKHLRSAKINGLYSADMDVNMPYYVPHDEIIYLCESLNISYLPGSTCTFSMGATYGKKPIMKINKEWVNQLNDGTYTISNVGVSALSGQLETLFTVDNAVTPTVYAQYKHLLTAAGTNVASPISTGNLPYFDATSNLAAMVNLKPVVKIDNPLPATTIPYKAGTNANPQYLPICCYNGYIWDGVSCISFEELVFNYGWLMAGKNIDGFRTTLAMGDRIMAPLYQYIPSSYMGLNATEEAIRAMQAFMVDMPAIETNGDFPSTWKAESIYFTDLAQSPFVTANNPQTAVSKSKGVVL